MKNVESVYNAFDYREFVLQKCLQSGPRSGLKSRLAKRLGCQPAYVSQVLTGTSHFSLEQGYDFCDFFNLNDEERYFFLLLLQKARAGHLSLKKFFENQIQEHLRKRKDMIHRLGQAKTLALEDQEKYYSSWIYAALHMAVTVPSLQSREALLKAFRINSEKLNQALQFLIGCGLVVQNGEIFRVGSQHLRIGNQSHHLVRHHSNWRLRALQSLESERDSEMHYSGVFSLSETDVQKIKDNLMEFLKTNLKIVDESKEERVYALCLDFFSAL